MTTSTDLEALLDEFDTGREHSRAEFLIEFVERAVARRVEDGDTLALDEIATAVEAYRTAEETDR